MPLSLDLLQHSRRLVVEQTRLAEPIEVELRRAISAAYYSSWHGVCDAIAAKFMMHCSQNSIANQPILAQKWLQARCSERKMHGSQVNVQRTCLSFVRIF
jgi:hypothetical protein